MNRGLLGEGVTAVMGYRCVAALKAEGFNVVEAYAVVGGSPSAFYAWRLREDGPTDVEWDEAT